MRTNTVGGWLPAVAEVAPEGEAVGSAGQGWVVGGWVGLIGHRSVVLTPAQRRRMGRENRPGKSEDSLVGRGLTLSRGWMPL